MNQSNIKYSVSLLSATEHLLSITMTLDVSPTKSLELCLPAWIPGSYMVRDFARNLHNIHAVAQSADNDANNEAIKLEQKDKQSWLLSTSTDTALTKVVVTYQIYAFDLSVRSAYINDEYAFFNGTSVFLYIKDQQHIAHTVLIESSSFASLFLHGTANIATAMPSIESNVQDVYAYQCEDYFTLIDHPFLIGLYEQHSFSFEGTQYHLVFTGEHGFDMSRMETDLRPIIKHHVDLFDGIPCQDYWFITLVCDGGFGGLEHLASTILQYSRFELPMPHDDPKMSDSYQRFLSLCSHELFHTWHVKRIKPTLMHQPDLSQEVYTPQLWIYEGFTSLYDDLSMARCGVITPKQYVQVLNENFTILLKNTGRHKQSVSSSSFEAWSKFYKQDAGSVNHIVSYYNKGAIIALCLDITLRQLSNGKHNIDSLMKILWAQYGQVNVGTPDTVIQEICKHQLDVNIESFLHLATLSTIDLPYHSLLKSIGLHMDLRASQSMLDKGGNNEGMNKADLGANISVSDKVIQVLGVFEGRAASQAGLQVGDKIIAFNHWQCDENRFVRLMNQFEFGESVPLHVLRDSRLIELHFPIQPAFQDTCNISIENETLFYDWLGLK